ncbi:ComEC/Rec2 family competence protein [Sphingomonas sp.]|uniref:ComEC/Rec2 family competence protein n=1 Tax=Sphingomonas sp. TaxID=28214 RepID=UPI00286B2581|nr:ComEC/Rec2 family competence protein [Sphingomonas sp.]
MEDASLEPAHRLFSPARLASLGDRLEAFLEAERGQLPLWFVASFGLGIAMWFALGDRTAWIGLLCVGGSAAMFGLAWRQGRAGRALAGFGIALTLGCSVIWLRSAMVAAPRLDFARMADVEGRIERVETLAAKGDLRLTITTASPGLPRKVRVSLPQDDSPKGLAAGARVKLKARLAPPPSMALPGTHDFARDAWFRGIGAVGRTIGPVVVIDPKIPIGLDRMRGNLDHHIRTRLPGSSGSIATALATGDQNAVNKDDAEAMRRSGLTHLLSVSGLHIAAAVGAAMLLTMRLLALVPGLAQRTNLVLVGAGVGALTGIGYTLLTGMQVPTVRSCVAAVLVLGGIAIGREALSLRLVAVGALLVLLFRPESLAGASFQLSFAAVTAIITLHSLASVRRLLGPRDDGIPGRLVRGVASLVATGLAVEIALIPLALYHFHKAGLYGVGANLIAIPWTTFVIMPLEAGALLLDTIGLGQPLWAATGWSIDQLLGLARYVAVLQGAVANLPSMSRWAFAAMLLGGLWFCLWTGRIRWLGIAPLAIGGAAAAMSPTPDLLVTGDGRHLAITGPTGAPVILRDRAGDFMRDLMSEAAGYDGDALLLSDQPFAECQRDSCVATIDRGGHRWVLLATRSRDRIAWDQLTAACRDADIVVSERWLPKACQPRWLKLDRQSLGTEGGVAIFLGDYPRFSTVAQRIGNHPWAAPPPPAFKPRIGPRYPDQRRPSAKPRARFPTDR